MAHVVVVGGGISGLTAAHRLSTISQSEKLDLQITLLEKNARLGGVIESEEESGYIIEHGPDCFVTDKPWALNLCQELDLTGNLIKTGAGNGKAFVAWRGRLQPLPDGFSMIAPSKIWPFIKSPLFSPLGKLRAACDLVLPRGKEGNEDESVAGFIQRRLGKELFERAGQALIGGIYTGDAGELSAVATMPRFIALEREHGSIIRGLRLEGREYRAGGPRYSLFQTLKKGLTGLTGALADSLKSESIRLKTDVIELSRKDGRSWSVITAGQETLTADAVILSVPADRAAQLVRGCNSELGSALASIECASSLVLNLLLKDEQLNIPAEAFGFVVPESEGGNILAASFISKKFVDRAPQGMVMVRVFIGGALQPGLLEKKDEELIGMALTDLRKYVALKGEPVKTWVRRWPKSMPQYHLGHARRVAQIDEMVRELGGLVLAGNCLHGVGIADCVRSGELAAQSVLESLKTHRLL
jgi:oxygen-dependent protoporphyrinogen oxidase